MVATLIRLRWSLTLNALRHNVWAVIGSVIGGLYGLAALVGLGAGAVGLGLAADTATVSLALAGVGALLVLGWTLVPLLLTGVDATLDPRALAGWIGPSRGLSLGLLAAGATGIPGVITALVCLMPVVTWALAGQWGAALLALVMAPVALALCVLTSRIVVTGAGISGTRRGRDMIGMVSVVVVLTASFIPWTLSTLDSAGSFDQVIGVVRVLAWTPFGWPFAAPGFLVAGRAGMAVAMCLGCCALISGLVPVWQRVVTHVMSAPAKGSSRARAYEIGSRTAGPGTADVLPWARRLGRVLPPVAAAIAARCLRYWRVDPRYLASVLGVALLPIVLVAMTLFAPYGEGSDADAVAAGVNLSFGHASAALLALAPGLALMTGWSIHDDLGFDSTAFWSHLSAGVRGRDDRLGRVAAVAVWQVPFFSVVVVGTTAWTGRWEWLPLIVGLGLALLGCALAWSCVTSVLLPYEANAPGDSPMKSRTSGTAMVAALIQMVGILAIGLATLPVSAGVIAVAVSGAWGWGGAVALLGLTWGVGLTWVGVVVGGRQLDRRGARLLATIRSWPGHAQPE